MPLLAFADNSKPASPFEALTSSTSSPLPSETGGGPAAESGFSLSALRLAVALDLDFFDSDFLD